MKRIIAFVLALIMLLCIGYGETLPREESYRLGLDCLFQFDVYSLQDAIAYFGNAGVYKDAELYGLYAEAVFDIASSDEDADALDKAVLILQILGEDDMFTAELEASGYRSCEELTVYINARRLEIDGAYAEAAEIYASIPRVLDATRRRIAITADKRGQAYDAAMELFNQGQYYLAAMGFKELKNYSDSFQMYEKCLSLHEHVYTEATCDSAAICDECGETVVEALGHDFENGVCIRCGAVEETEQSKGIDAEQEIENSDDWEYLDEEIREGGDFRYRLYSDGTIELVCYYSGDATKVIVPERIDGYQVTGIGVEQFHYIKKEKTQNGVVEHYYRPDQLISIELPDSVVNIKGNPFCYCDNLVEIKVSDNHPTFETINGVLFDKTKNRLICYPDGLGDKAYTAPNGIDEIGNRAFYGCSTLESIVLPESLVSIGDEAFRGCRKLTSLTLPDNLKQIGNFAFTSCDRLTSIAIPNSVVDIGSNPFATCHSLKTITLSKEHPCLAMQDGFLISKTDNRMRTESTSAIPVEAATRWPIS